MGSLKIQETILKIVIFSCAVSLVLCQDNSSTVNNSGDSNISDARTFGHHFLKRISFAIIPAAFVVGVITTLLAALTVVSIKGLGVGVILLVIAFGQILARFLPTQSSLPISQYQAPSVPYVYSHRQDPVWLEKTWR